MRNYRIEQPFYAYRRADGSDFPTIFRPSILAPQRHKGHRHQGFVSEINPLALPDFQVLPTHSAHRNNQASTVGKLV
jgi:hypothetical protein